MSAIEAVNNQEGFWIGEDRPIDLDNRLDGPNLWENTVSLMMQYLGRHYVRRFNYVHNRTGTLWEGRYKSSLVDSDRYVLACYGYIENNPVKANMVASPGEYRWSSYHANARGIDSALLTAHPCYEQLAKNKQARQRAYSQLFGNPDAGSLDTEIHWV